LHTKIPVPIVDTDIATDRRAATSDPDSLQVIVEALTQEVMRVPSHRRIGRNSCTSKKVPRDSSATRLREAAGCASAFGPQLACHQH